MTAANLDARAAALLDARAAALAARPAARERPAETTAFLVCACGTERCGVALAAVAGVTPERPCTALPGAPAALSGIAAMAGIIVSVLDLAACLGLDRAERDPGNGQAVNGHVVRLRGGEPPVALVVDRVLGIARIDMARIDMARIDMAIARSGAAGPEALGDGPYLGYAPPGSDRAGEIRDGFSVLDLPALLARFLARPPGS